MRIPNIRRVDIDWEYLRDCIYQAGYTQHSMADKVGRSPSVFYYANRDKKMNPLIVEEISKNISVDVNRVLLDDSVKQVRNGSSASKRQPVKWDELKMIAYERGFSIHDLSISIGKSGSYLGGCKKVGGISNEIIKEIAKVLDIDRDELKERILESKSQIKKKIQSMVDDSCAGA